ncbi:MAG TPA: LuxR C-terminal-related transcriptional regulator [Egibacteraceae bacterium]|nr:LuxR C-terminal-related transcriptional regulator [Egibacteraceae bacterium]
MLRWDKLQGARDALVRLTREGHDLVSFWKASAGVLGRVVPHWLGPCWFTIDPASLLVTSHFAEGVPELAPEALAAEYYTDDVNQLADVARSRRGVSTLHEATAGDPSSSPRWHQNMAYGGDQELIAALRTPGGEVWGAVGLYREPGERLFDEREIEFVRSVAPHLADGARRALLLGEAMDPDRPDAPGLIVLSDTWEVESATPGVERWLSDLPDGDWDAGRLPAAVVAVAGRALGTAEHPDEPDTMSLSRVLSRSGVWVVLHGASLVTGGARRVAVIVEPAHPARIAPLLMAAYGLTQREQDVTRLVLQGDSTAQIASRLHLSPHTVQQHLKRVFDKTGVRSRRDLVGKIFFAHYEPRLRDNERRALDSRPLRGGPMPAANLTSVP